MAIPIAELGSNGDLRWLGNRREQYVPFLAMMDTGEMFDQIPQNGPWRLPQSSKDFWKFSRERWDGLLGDWVKYLNQVEVGLQKSNEAAKNNRIMGDAEERAIDAFDYFKRGGIEVTQDSIRSVKRAFVALLSPKAREELGVKVSKKGPSEQDVHNARTVVRNFELTIPKLGWLGEIDEDE